MYLRIYLGREFKEWGQSSKYEAKVQSMQHPGRIKCIIVKYHYYWVVSLIPIGVQQVKSI